MQSKLLSACAELVEMISSAANEASTKENKSTIHPEHVVAALDQMGFAELKESAAAFLQQWKDEKKGENHDPASCVIVISAGKCPRPDEPSDRQFVNSHTEAWTEKDRS